MARKPAIDESQLRKMELRKLNALRKSVGDAIGEQAFLDWQRSRPGPQKADSMDKTAEAIGDAIMVLLDSGKIKGLPRGGYIVKRGRGRVVVTQAD